MFNVCFDPRVDEILTVKMISFSYADNSIDTNDSTINVSMQRHKVQFTPSPTTGMPKKKQQEDAGETCLIFLGRELRKTETEERSERREGEMTRQGGKSRILLSRSVDGQGWEEIRFSLPAGRRKRKNVSN